MFESKPIINSSRLFVTWSVRRFGQISKSSRSLEMEDTNGEVGFVIIANGSSYNMLYCSVVIYV
jgi:hypothetical protein